MFGQAPTHGTARTHLPYVLTKISSSMVGSYLACETPGGSIKCARVRSNVHATQHVRRVAVTCVVAGYGNATQQACICLKCMSWGLSACISRIACCMAWTYGGAGLYIWRSSVPFWRQSRSRSYRLKASRTKKCALWAGSADLRCSLAVPSMQCMGHSWYATLRACAATREPDYLAILPSCEEMCAKR